MNRLCRRGYVDICVQVLYVITGEGEVRAGIESIYGDCSEIAENVGIGAR